jgi:hypothetical protein
MKKAWHPEFAFGATDSNTVRTKEIAGTITLDRECGRDRKGNCSGFVAGRQGEADH